MHFLLSVLCLKQGNTIEEVAVNRVCIVELFFPSRVRVLRTSAAPLYPKMGLPSGGGGVGLETGSTDSVVTASLRDVQIS